MRIVVHIAIALDAEILANAGRSGPEKRLYFRLLPDVESALAGVLWIVGIGAVGIFGGIEGALRAGQIALHVLKDSERGVSVLCITCKLEGFQIGDGQLD